MSKITKILTSVNTAPSGSFVGITNYEDSKGNISSIIGNLGFSYQNAKEKAIDSLKSALEHKDFHPITVKGTCYCENGVFNSRKRSWDAKDYSITFGKKAVMETAQEILDGWLAPSKRVNNKVKLSDKENGLVLNTETEKISFSLLVEKQTFKAELTEANKAEKGIEDKVKMTMPVSALKAIIRTRFERKFKQFVIEVGKFDTLSIGGTKFDSAGTVL